METIIDKYNPQKFEYPVIRIIGLALIALSFAMFLLPDIYTEQFKVDFFSGSFWMTYTITVGYLIAILVVHIVKQSWNIFKLDAKNLRLFIVLFSISAFSLNTNLPVTAEPTDWLKIYIVIIQLSLILFVFEDILPSLIKKPLWFLFGAGSVIALYYSIILIPLVPAGLMFSWFFGISVHSFISHIWLAAFLVPLFTRKNKSLRFSFLIGAVVPTLIATVFMISWIQFKHSVEEIYIAGSKDLPEWVAYGQQLSDNPLTEWALKSDLIYETDIFGGLNFFGSPFSGGVVRHDPLSATAIAIFGEADLDRDTRAKILEARYNLRHESIPRLWSDENLSTESIHTDVKIMPEYRLAYIEKTITIKNSDYNEWMVPQEEAVYSFHMPEGAVVTSSSLWIEGIEEKGRLTTKEKADSAYSTIVGRERRDPSVTQWQEGNKMIVRVFPCTPEEDRKFKIGFTVPLRYENRRLNLDKIHFEGPDFGNAEEEVLLKIDKQETEITVENLSKDSDNSFSYKGGYLKHWNISMPAPPLSDKAFSFNNKSYRLDNLVKRKGSFIANNVFLDINRSWTKSEYDKILELYDKKQIYVFEDKLIEVTTENSDDIFYRLNQLQFSLFPIYEIKDLESSLLITKSDNCPVLLSDLSDSPFYEKTYDFLSSTSGKLKVCDIGSIQSEYIKALKEYQTLDYASCKVSELIEYSGENVFPVYDSKPNRVAVETSDMTIVQDTAVNESDAPDHLLRLFAYNMILKETGRNRFNKDYINTELIALAREAYVVSPISSLIVLETVKDYERFDIDEPDKSQSLLNATQESSGAVPEPHEWALIIMALGIAMWLFIRRVRVFKNWY